MLVLVNGSAGATVVEHVSLPTVIRLRFRLRAVTWLKLPLSHVIRVLSSLTLPRIAGFLRILQFPSVVTLGPLGVALTGPLKRRAQVADRVIHYKYTLPLLFRRDEDFLTWPPLGRAGCQDFPIPNSWNMFRKLHSQDWYFVRFIWYR